MVTTKELKVLFVGVGSIAKRHIRNLKEICNIREISVHIDALRRTNSTEAMEIDCVYINKEFLPMDYDIIFITNPTEYHLETFSELHNHGKHFFIEKPICSVGQLKNATSKMESLKLRTDSIYYVACPLRYTSVIKYLKQNINLSDIISVRCISSSYLPDWRPGQDYRETYSAHTTLGGGVDIDLIHEWDYISYLLGVPNQVKSLIGKKSNLEIDSNDYAIYVAEYEDKIVELHLDYFGRKPIREAMIIMKEDTIVADLITGTISYLKQGKIIELNEDRDTYQKAELEFLLSEIERNEILSKESIEGYEVQNNYGIRHAIEVMRYTQGGL